MSIKYRLISQLLIVVLLIVGSASWMSYQDIQEETGELFDAQLARSARLILSLLQADSGHSDFSSIQKYLDENQFLTAVAGAASEDLAEKGHVYETKLGFQIWDRDGNLILKSDNVPIAPISQRRNGYSTGYFLANKWRVFSLTSSDGHYQCVTAERIDVRNDLINKISEDLLLVIFIFIPFLLVVIWLLINQDLAPLQNLAMQIDARGVEKLHSVSQENVPQEIQTIATAINNLLQKLKQALARERRLSSDAAHEIRTPLAAIKLHAELAQSATSRAQREASLNHVLEGIDRTTHLVEQLLALAKLEPGVAGNELESVDLKSLLVDEVAQLTPLAHKKNIDISIDAPVNINTDIQATPLSLILLIRNLVSNAINYTQEGGCVRISLSAENQRLCLQVEDNGPGIAEEERERVLDRFYRVENHSSAGCGIGLSIVRRAVELCHAGLSLDVPDSGRGLLVRVCFPQ